MTIMAAATAMYACPECGVLELFDDEHIGLEGRVLRWYIWRGFGLVDRLPTC